MATDLNSNLKNMSRLIQVGIAAAVVLCMTGVFYMYVLQDLIEQSKAQKNKIASLTTAVAKGTAVESQVKRFEMELATLEERLVVLQSILPEEKETAELLRNIQQMAMKSNLKINQFEPRSMEARDFYSNWPIEIEVEGNYHGLGLFFEKISQYPRIIDIGKLAIRNIDHQTDPNRTLVASCTAVTYVFNPEQAVKSANSVGNNKENKNKNKNKENKR